jgi:hypothetical protein
MPPSREEKTFLEVLLIGALGAGGKIAWDELSKRATRHIADKVAGKLSDKDGARQRLGRTIASMEPIETANLRRRLAEAQKEHREDKMKNQIGTLLYEGKTQDEVDANKKFVLFFDKLDDAGFAGFLPILDHDDWAQILLRFLESGGKIAEQDAAKLGAILHHGGNKLDRAAGHAARGLNHLADWFANSTKGGR